MLCQGTLDKEGKGQAGHVVPGALEKEGKGQAGHVRQRQVVKIRPGEVNAMERLYNKARQEGWHCWIPRTWACGRVRNFTCNVF
jgi:hypothetical protein